VKGKEGCRNWQRADFEKEERGYPIFTDIVAYAGRGFNGSRAFLMRG
jgi:hypothetical protein